MPVLIIRDGDRTCAYRRGSQTRSGPAQSSSGQQPQLCRGADHDDIRRFEPSLSTASSDLDDEIPGWLPEYKVLD